MAVSAETRNSIIELVVTAYNAAPGTALLTDLVEAADGGASLSDIATTLTTSTTFKAIYPTFQTATEFATEFLGNLVPEASADALAEGISVVESVLNGGGTRADVILQAASYLAALSESDPSFGSSAALFNNKVEVATYHTVTLELDSESIATLQSTLATVTSSDDSVTTAKAAADTTANPPAAGQTFTLTTGLDNVTGGAGDDSISLTLGTGATWAATDMINGGEGVDTLVIVDLDANGSTIPATLNVSNVEALTARGAGALTIDVATTAFDNVITTQSTSSTVTANAATNVGISAATGAVTVNGGKDISIIGTTAAQNTTVGTTTAPKGAISVDDSNLSSGLVAVDGGTSASVTVG
ncbi:MAG: hypothetical protein O2948_04520, partial [Proteobacteria bacterium]|nr:hypothetical protein [Pseudomonadota bacterium]